MANENYRFDVWPKENGDVETAEGDFDLPDPIRRTYRRGLDGRVCQVDGDYMHAVFEGFRPSGDPLYVAEGESLADVIRAQRAASQRN